jgi:hypothetical protein
MDDASINILARAYNGFPMDSLWIDGKFVTFDVAGVADFTAVRNKDGSIRLSWTNPEDEGFVGVRLAEYTRRYPVTPTDGRLLYEGVLEEFTITNARNKNYRFTIHASYGDPRWSSGARFRLRPQ